MRSCTSLNVPCEVAARSAEDIDSNVAQIKTIAAGLDGGGNRCLDGAKEITKALTTVRTPCSNCSSTQKGLRVPKGHSKPPDT